jgi:hypothetical protein
MELMQLVMFLMHALPIDLWRRNITSSLYKQSDTYLQIEDEVGAMKTIIGDGFVTPFEWLLSSKNNPIEATG